MFCPTTESLILEYSKDFPAYNPYAEIRGQDLFYTTFACEIFPPSKTCYENLVRAWVHDAANWEAISAIKSGPKPIKVDLPQNWYSIMQAYLDQQTTTILRYNNCPMFEQTLALEQREFGGTSIALHADVYRSADTSRSSRPDA